MGLFAKLVYRTPLAKLYREFNRRKWIKAHQLEEEALFPIRMNFYQAFLKAGDLVFDVGANVGNRCRVFLAIGAKVVAIEPQPACADHLRDSFGNKISVERVGLSDQEGILKMKIATDSTVSTFDNDYIIQTKSKFKHTEWTDTIDVEVTTLDNLIAKYGTPRFCKIDVEGFELQVLKGLNSRIPILSIEYIVPERKQSTIECLRELHNLSPDGIFNYSVGETMKWALNTWIPFDEFILHVETSEFQKTGFGDIYFKT